jgi:magnesium chelatase subunit I
VVERDGVSHTHAARFVLIGTMNPEEGELRPQLSDRFGLAVALENCRDVAMRERIVKTRLAFDLDAVGFCARYADAEATLARQVVTARNRLADLPFSDAVHRQVSQRCLDAGVDGLRADLVMLKAARALAALEAAPVIDIGHVSRVAGLVLLHRRTVEEAHAPDRSSGSAASMKREGAGDDLPNEAPNEVPNEVANAAANVAGDASGEASATGNVARSDAFGMGRKPPAMPSSISEQASVSGRAMASDGGSDDGATGNANAGAFADTNADWGYLAPEPVATLAAKKLRPFPAKKA